MVSHQAWHFFHKLFVCFIRIRLLIGRWRRSWRTNPGRWRWGRAWTEGWRYKTTIGRGWSWRHRWLAARSTKGSGYKWSGQSWINCQPTHNKIFRPSILKNLGTYLLAFSIVVLTKSFFLFEQQVSLQVLCRLLAQQLLFLLVAHFDIDIVDMSIYAVEPCDSENRVYVRYSTKCYGLKVFWAQDSALIPCTWTNGACCGTTVEACRGVNGCW